MGSYDTVNLQCPHCDQINKLQVKTGPCSLKIYTSTAVPVDVASGVVGYTFTCDECGTNFTVHARTPKIELYTLRAESEEEEDDEG